MADEDNEAEGKKKFSLKIILLLVVVLLVLSGGAVAALYFMGYIGGGADKPAASAEQALQQVEQQAAASAPAAAPGGPPPLNKVTRQSPELTRFEQTYLELERDFIVNLTNSRKVMQVQIALMTHYDKRVFDNVKKHEFALRSVTLDVMRQATEADLARPNFRTEMAEKIRTEMNTVLEKYQDFGGIEAVYFTNFVIQ